MTKIMKLTFKGEVFNVWAAKENSKDCLQTGFLTTPPTLCHLASKQEVPPQNSAGCDDDAV